MLKTYFNNLKLSRKLLILYIFSVFLPIVLTNITFYFVTTENVKEQKMHDISLALRQIQNDFHESVNDAISVSSFFYTDNTINEFLDHQYSTTLEYVMAYDAYLRGFNKYSAMFTSVEAINFYTENETVITSGGVSPLTDEVKLSEWYREMPFYNKAYPIVMRTGTTDEKDTISVIKELNYFDVYNQHQKIVKVDLDREGIKHIFNNVTFEGNVYLLNPEGIIEYSNDQSINWKQGSLSMKAIQLPEGANLLDESYVTSNYLNGWKVVGIVSEHELLQEVYKSRRFILYLAFFNFLVPTIIIVLISNSLNLRIKRILKYMKKMKDQSFEIIRGAEYKDEIGQLTSEFNRMSSKIKELIYNVYLSDIQKKDLELQRKQAQLSALQSQINPHFLFNTLETIRMRSLIKQEAETAKIIQNMAKMLRSSFTWGRDWVTVQEEMTIVYSFLEIQKYRFEDKLHYKVELDQEAASFVIPNMILLPFVENASIHGIEPKKGQGFINISIKLTEKSFEFAIKDNGPGISPERLQELKESLEREDSIGENVGIKNVYYRLKMYYAEDFYFDITSSEVDGTTVTIRLPRLKK